jgi:hypothetical protein
MKIKWWIHSYWKDLRIRHIELHLFPGFYLRINNNYTGFKCIVTILNFDFFLQGSIKEENKMLTQLQIVLQYGAIVVFFGLSAISGLQHQWNSAFINLCLAVFYVFLYLSPIK